MSDTNINWYFYTIVPRQSNIMFDITGQVRCYPKIPVYKVVYKHTYYIILNILI